MSKAKVTKAWAVVDLGKLDCWDERLPLFWLKHCALDARDENSCADAEVIEVEIRPVRAEAEEALMSVDVRESPKKLPRTLWPDVPGAHPSRELAEHIHEHGCPDCHGTEFLEGPHGGLSVNFMCAGCGSCFNDLGPFGVERISHPSERTP